MSTQTTNTQIVGKSSEYDKKYMSAEDVAKIEELSYNAQLAKANGASDPKYHNEAEAIRNKYGYSGGARGDEYIPLQNTQANQTTSNNDAAAGLAAIVAQQQAQQRQSEQKLAAMTSTLNNWLEASKKQQQQAADYATAQGITELQRAEQDAQAQFQTQRNQIATDEAKAKDNQALYAEARGDKGGIGAAQYNSIMNTAAQNRLAVSNAQTKLATDTARQIADLRAQGEFQKADAILQLSQQYLSQLMSMEQWGMEYSLSVAEFNAQLQQWLMGYQQDQQKIDQDNLFQEAELTGMYKGNPTLDATVSAAELSMKEAGLTGMYNGQLTLDAQQIQNSNLTAAQKELANNGLTLLKLGLQPSAEQLAVMGITAEEAQSYIARLKNEQTNAQNSQLASDGLALLRLGIEPSPAQLSALGLTKAQAQSYITSLQTEEAVQATESDIATMLSFNDDVKALEYLVGKKYSATVHSQLWEAYLQNKPVDDKTNIEAAMDLTVDDLSSDGKKLLDTIRRSYNNSGNGNLPDSALDLILESDLDDVEIYLILKLCGYNLKNYL